MYYLLGVITGLLVATILVLSTLICDRKAPNLNERAKSVLDSVIPPERGQTFKPKDLEEVRKDKILQKNNEEGRDTKLTDLL